MSEYVVKDWGWLMISTERHRPGCFLDEENKCQIYDARPYACKTYPDWPEIWGSIESLSKETKICPGLKAGYHSYFLD